MDAEAYLPSAETIGAIERDIANYNERRRRARDDVARRMPVLMGSFAFGGAVALYFIVSNYRPLSETALNILLFLWLGGAIFGGTFVYKLARQPGKDTQQGFRDHMLPVLFGFVDSLRYATGFEPGSFGRMPAPLKGSFNHKSFDDIVTGRLDGKRFEIYEMELKRKSKSSDVTIFKGVVLNCQAEAGIAGTLVAMRRPDSGLFQSIDAALKSIGELFRGERMERISSRSRLDNVYDFLTDNIDEARPLLAGRVGEVLTWVNKTWRSGNPLLAVRRNELFLLLPSQRNFFELPPLDIPLDYRAHLEPMVRDFASLLAIVKEVQKEPPQPATNVADEAGDVAEADVPVTEDRLVPLLDDFEPPRTKPTESENPA
jgi:hypothetical protein